VVDEMSKAGDTKRRILEMLKRKSMTMTDISRTLGLAPSTVTQHLQEMENAGAIRLVRSRKLKYYELNEYPSVKVMQPAANNMKRIAIPIAVIALIAVFGFAYYASSSSTPYASAQQVYVAPGSNVPSGSTVFTVSDTPTFYNITGLFITIENVSIHSSTTGKWYNIPLQTSSFNLIQLKNISSILSSVKLSNGTYNELVFHISKVEATVNGTNQSVFLPTNSLRILGSFNISNNGTTNWINIDFDLQHSLHITQNGSIIMLPVLNIRHARGPIELNQSSIIISSSPLKIRAFYEFGMDANGIMTRNYTTPQNWSINSYGGRLEVNRTAGVMPIIMGGRHGFIMGGDANALIWQHRGNFTMNGSWSSNVSITVHDRNGMEVPCMLRNGALSCNANMTMGPGDVPNMTVNGPERLHRPWGRQPM
jgi:DNA-binding transcriptional ArsR family regulator